MCSKNRQVVEAVGDNGDRMKAGKIGGSGRSKLKARAKKSEKPENKKSRNVRMDTKVLSGTKQPPSNLKPVPKVERRKKESVMPSDTVFENAPPPNMTRDFDVNQNILLEQQALADQKPDEVNPSIKNQQTSKIVKQNEEEIHRSEIEALDSVPDLLNDPNTYSPIKVDKEKVLWTPEMTTFELRLRNVNLKRRAFKIRCTDDSYFRIDPVYGYIENWLNHGYVTVTIHVLRLLKTQQTIKIESIEVKDDAESKYPQGSFQDKEQKDKQFTIVEVIPPPHPISHP